MGVYIKSMEMPKGCFFCSFNRQLDPDRDKCVLTGDAFDSTFRVIEHRRDNCPLVYVPPHGRLIDADALPWEKQGLLAADEDWALPCSIIENAHTVIEAEEGE